METLEKIKLLPLKLPEDKEEISSWQQEYSGKDCFKSIEHFILEDKIFYNLGEVVETNYEIIHIGENEKKLAFVAKNQKGKIIAWVLLQAFELDTNEPEMFLQYIVVHPEYQHSGIGTQIAKQIFLNPETLIEVKPAHIFSYIHKENLASQKLFQSLNFKLSDCGENYLRAYTQEPKFLKENKPTELGE